MKKYSVVIEPEQCKGCGRCVLACPRSVLKMNSKLNSMSNPSAYYTGTGCVGCGGCFYTCPEPGAVTIFEEEVEK